MVININGINFELVEADKCAAVVKGEYKETVVIPSAVEYAGVEYYVSAVGEEAFADS